MPHLTDGMLSKTRRVLSRMESLGMREREGGQKLCVLLLILRDGARLEIALEIVVKVGHDGGSGEKTNGEEGGGRRRLHCGHGLHSWACREA